MPFDYITLMLVNMAAGLLVLAAYFAWGTRSFKPAWAPAFGAVGLVATLLGGHMVFVWPISKALWANMAFGEMTVLFGALYLAAAWGLAKDWHLRGLGIYSAVAGLAAIVLGAGLWHHQLTAAPMLSSIGFVLTGFCGVLACPTLLTNSRVLRAITATLLVLAAGVWMFIGLGGYWMHLGALAGK